MLIKTQPSFRTLKKKYYFMSIEIYSYVGNNRSELAIANRHQER